MGVTEVDGSDGRRWTISRHRYWPGWREVFDVGPPPESRSRKIWGGRRSERVAEELAREVRQISV